MTHALLSSVKFSQKLTSQRSTNQRSTAKLTLSNCDDLGQDLMQQVTSQQVVPWQSMAHNRIGVSSCGVEHTAMLAIAIAQTKEILQHFAEDPARFAEVMAAVFGGETNQTKQGQFRQQWQQGKWQEGEFVLPEVRVLSSSAMGLQVVGAYSKQTAQIYLSEALIASQDLHLIRRVLLEEIGHAIDDQLNSIETPGDEGDLFAALVLGENLTPAKIAAIRQEDDHGWVWVDGGWVAVEQAGGVLLRTNVFGDNASNPANLTVIGTTMYFTADDGVNGIELWKTDGTASGTALVANINPGAGSSSPSNLININGVLYFLANDGVNGIELWRSDGTANGTTLVKDINPNGDGSISGLTSFNGKLYFAANDGANGTELWQSDGTDAGTTLVKDIFNGISNSSPTSLVSYNGSLYFAATDSTGDRELWKSDGTANGTVQVANINASGNSSPANLTVSGGKLFFSATNGSSAGVELWSLDNTGIPFMVRDIRSGGTGSITPASANFTDVNGTLFFAANGGSGTELWKSDGTSSGTVLVRDLNTTNATASSSPASLTNVNGTLYFAATDGINGTELWKSDGTSAGTVLVQDINSTAANASSIPTSLVNVNGTLYFRATDGINGTELWKTDANGTSLVKDIRVGSSSSNLSNLVNFNGTLFFVASDAVTGAELWKSDGTTAGTQLARNVNSVASANVAPAAVGSTLYFAANDGISGNELWKTDGTANGTVLVKDIAAGFNSANPTELTNVNGVLYFTASDGLNGTELWKSDGTGTNTVLVKNINPGAGGSSPSRLTNVNGTLFFTANDSTNGVELWKSDGTDAGTVLVKDINVGGSSTPTLLTAVGTKLYFLADNGVNGTELWQSDGTSGGTVLVRDIVPGATSTSITNLFNFNGTLFFVANDVTNGAELWKTDGTTGGTVLVKDIFVGLNGANPSNFTVIGTTMYFTADDGVNGAELWKTDGTTGGTVLVKDINTGATGSGASSLVNINGTLYFAADNGANGLELWKSDGTANGTVLVKDIVVGAGGSAPVKLINVNNTLFFAANDGVNGLQLYQSDGTANGTAELRLGSNPSIPDNLINVNGNLFLTAVDPNTGLRGVWKANPNANLPPVAVDDAVITSKISVLSGNVLVANPTTADSDPEGGLLTVTAVNGQVANVGTQIAVGNGLLRVNSNGTFTFDPNGGYNALNPGDQATTNFTYTIDDGSGGTATATVTITITGSSNPPVLDVATTGSLSYTEKAAATAISPTGLGITDPDNTTLASATVQITGGYQNGEDLLSFTGTLPNGITSAFDGATGKLTLTGSASLATYQTLLQQVGYSNTSSNPNTGNRTVSFTVSDGGASSNVVTRTVTVAAVNDPPSVNIPASFTVNEDTSLSLGTIGLVDPDAGTGTLTVSLSVTNGKLTFGGTTGLAITSGANNSAAITLTGSLTSFNTALATLSYQGNQDFNGTDTLGITINDGGNTGSGVAQTATVNRTITVTAVNDPVTGAPTATLGTGTEDTNYNITAASLLQGFADVDIATNGQVLTVQNLTATNGTVTNNNNGTYTFAPNANFNGTVTLTYDVTDGNTSTLTNQTRTFTVTAVNDPVTGAPTATLTPATEDTPYTITATDLLQGFSDVDVATNGQVVTVQNLTASVGTITNNNNGTYTFNAPLNFNGNVTLTYSVTDSNGSTLTNQTRTFTVTAVNDPVTGAPTATLSNGTRNVAYTVNASTLLQGFSDVDIATNGQVLTVQNLSPSVGTLTNNNNGTYTINFPVDYAGPVTLTYNVTDSNGSTLVGQTRSFDVLAIINNPVTGAPTATLANGTEDTAYTINATSLLQGFSDTDVPANGQTLTVLNLTANNGTITNNNNGTYTFTPNLDYNGAVTLTYDVTDSSGSTLTGQTRSFNLAAVNDPVTGAPTAVLGAATEDTPYSITAASLLQGFADVDIATNGQVLTVQNLSASVGTITNNNNGTYTFNAPLNFNGNVTLTYSVTDSNGSTLTNQTRTFTVTAVNDPVTGAPTAVLAAGVEDTAYTVNVSSLLQGFADVDIATNGQVLTVQNLTATNGTLTNNNNGTYTFNPNQDYNGTVTLTYDVTDSSGSTLTGQTRAFNLAAVNDPITGAPSAVLAAATEDTPYTITTANLVQGLNDVDIATNGQVLTVQNLTASVGTLTNNSGTYTFNPPLNFNGTVTLTYNVTDSNGSTLTGLTRTFTVNPVNDPVTGAPTATLTDGVKNAPYNVTAATLLQGFSDVDIATNNQVLSVGNLVADKGTVVDNGNGTFTVTPQANYVGPVKLTYSVTDGSGSTLTNQTRTFSIPIPPNSPVTGAPTVSLTNGNEDVPYVVDTALLLQGFSDADVPANGQALTVINLKADKGTLVNNNDGTYTLTPNRDYNGAVTLTYDVTDSNGSTLTNQTRTLTLAAVNDPIVGTATAVFVAGTEDTPYSFLKSVLLEGFTDADIATNGQVLTVLNLTASNGTLVENNGTYTFNPNQDYNGTVTLTYDISDGNGSVRTGVTRTFTLAAVNDPVTGAPTFILASGSKNNPYTVTAADLLKGFSDVDIATNGQVLRVVNLASSQGTLVNNNNGTYTITPPANFVGAVTLTYGVTDDNGSTLNNQTRTFNVLDIVNSPVTGAPTANLSAATEDTPYTINEVDLLQGFGDLDAPANGQVLRVVNLAATNGTITINPNNTFTFKPNANYNGNVTLTYDVIDGNGSSLNGQTRTFAVNPVNDPVTGAPTANLAGGTINVPYVVNAADLLKGFSDVDIATNNQVLKVQNLAANNGTVVDNNDGTFTITSSNNYTGLMGLTYDVTDGSGSTLTNQSRQFYIQGTQPNQINYNSDNIVSFTGGLGLASVQVQILANPPGLVNELAIYRTDDGAGLIGGVAPGQANYRNQALLRAKSIGSSVTTNTSFSDFTRQLALDPTGFYGFLLVQNGTVDEVRSGGSGTLLFGSPSGNGNSSFLNILRQTTASLRLGFEDGAGTRNFTDAFVNFSLVSGAPPIEAGLQGEPQGEVIDLRSFTGTVNATFTVSRSAAFNNTVGFYVIANALGQVRDGGGNLINPGDAGYLQVAMQNRVDIALQGVDQRVISASGTFQGGTIIAPFIAINSGLAPLLDSNANNDPAVMFPFLNANPGKLDRIRLLGDNTFGFEDLITNSDLDYNDLVIKIKIG